MFLQKRESFLVHSSRHELTLDSHHLANNRSLNVWIIEIFVLISISCMRLQKRGNNNMLIWGPGGGFLDINSISALSRASFCIFEPNLSSVQVISRRWRESRKKNLIVILVTPLEPYYRQRKIRKAKLEEKPSDSDLHFLVKNGFPLKILKNGKAGGRGMRLIIMGLIFLTQKQLKISRYVLQVP